jgi:hypothetical protein
VPLEAAANASEKRFFFFVVVVVFFCARKTINFSFSVRARAALDAPPNPNAMARSEVAIRMPQHARGAG